MYTSKSLPFKILQVLSPNCIICNLSYEDQHQFISRMYKPNFYKLFANSDECEP